MATAGDPKSKDLPDELDGNKVHPSGGEKPKKKGLFSKSSKSEGKTKSKEGKKDAAKEESLQKETANDKKSEKAESKKEGILRFYLRAPLCS